jgi:hypothetical protein
MVRMSIFLTDLPRLVIEAQRTILCPTIFTWWYLAFVNILKGNVVFFLFHNALSLFLLNKFPNTTYKGLNV